MVKRIYSSAVMDGRVPFKDFSRWALVMAAAACAAAAAAAAACFALFGRLLLLDVRPFLMSDS